MKLGLQMADTNARLLLKEQEKSRMNTAWLSKLGGKRDGCFGEVFMEIFEDQDFFGRKIGARYLGQHIVNI